SGSSPRRASMANPDEHAPPSKPTTPASMIEFYPQVRLVHIVCVVLSGSLFSVRGMLMLARSPYTHHNALRRLSQLIDTALLVAALFLISMLHQYPFVQSWLTVKVVLLVVYIVLGIFALHAGRT